MNQCLALLILVASFITVQAADAEKGLWMNDYQAAVAKATKENKPLLLDFTGSDWCHWCMKLHTEVFDTKEFKEWAEKKVVLMEVDFPAKKPLDAHLKKQNGELKSRFAIKGFPTIIFLDPTGKNKLGESGYQAGGAKAWTDKADEIMSSGTGKKK